MRNVELLSDTTLSSRLAKRQKGNGAAFGVGDRTQQW